VHGEASVLLSFGLVFYCSAGLYGLYKQARRALLLSVVIADIIRMYRKTGQWKRIRVSMLEGGVLTDPGDTERGVPVGILSATLVRSTGTLKYNLTVYVSSFIHSFSQYSVSRQVQSLLQNDSSI